MKGDEKGGGYGQRCHASAWTLFAYSPRESPGRLQPDAPLPTTHALFARVVIRFPKFAFRFPRVEGDDRLGGYGQRCRTRVWPLFVHSPRRFPEMPKLKEGEGRGPFVRVYSCMHASGYPNMHAEMMDSGGPRTEAPWGAEVGAHARYF